MQVLEADKIGSATSPLKLTKTVAAISENRQPKAGDVIVVRALSESVTYRNLELPDGRLAKINRGVIGGIAVLKNLGIEIDVITGSVTDSQMGEDFVQKEFGINAGNTRRDGLRLFELINFAKRREMAFA